MARARCDKSVEAEKLYNGGMKLCDIARRLSVPDATVRRWKSKQGWGKKKQSERSLINEKRSLTKANENRTEKPNRNRGGQTNNTNAVKHGGYMQMYSSVLSENEMELLPLLMKMTPKERLNVLYSIMQMREINMLGYINSIESGADVTHEKTIIQSGQGKTNKIKETRKNQLPIYNDALTRLQAEMRKTAETLQKIDDREIDDSSIDAVVELLSEVRKQSDEINEKTG
jgi:uncharacterized protein YjcR